MAPNHGRFKNLERRVDAAIARGSGASSPFFPNDHHEVKEETFCWERESRFFSISLCCFMQIGIGYEIGEDYRVQPKALRDVSVGSGWARVYS